MIRTALLLLAAACLAAAEKPVTIYLYSEYIDPEITKAFTEKTGMPVRIDTYEAQEEMTAKLQAGGDAQYDVVVATDVVVPALVALKLLQPIDQKKITHIGNVDSRFRNAPFDPGNKWSLPYQWGTVGLLYRKDKAPEGQPTWAWVLGDQPPATFVLMDEMRTMLGVTLRSRGCSMNSHLPAEVRAAAEVLGRAKRSAKCLGFDGGTGVRNKVMAGDAVVGVAYNGDAVRAMLEDKGLAYAIPREGSNIWVDNMVIPAKAPNPAGAHAFIDYILDAEVGAQLSNFNRYASPNGAAMAKIREEDRKNPAIYPDQETVKNLEYLEDVGIDSRYYDEAWTDLKAK
ncbi:MAG TPA: spermidine/putrescine ABC transporter substrate-binding protein [Kofleriaceae bacterium]|nr:spermidine/putrescine ABC transporter substrate-binding protein [Kofleriaceae bacterium]